MSKMFEGGNIEIVKLADWLDWSSGINDNVFIALPMIQRGSVWKPTQIIELWDSLFRGMPIGSFIVNDFEQGTDIRRLGRNEMESAQNHGLCVLDGQQRSLTMLLGWPGNNVDRRIWVDFGDTPPEGQEFRLRVTTQNQPFGFQRSAPSTKLSLSDRRKAQEEFLRTHPNSKKNYYEFDLNETRPYSSKLPLQLQELIKILREDETYWFDKIKNRIMQIDLWANLNPEQHIQVENRIAFFKLALKRLFTMQIALIKLDSSLYDKTIDDIEPPLAVLFKRIGTGGTELSDEDYAYSVLKHREPRIYTLVEGLHSQGTIASLLSANNLVMTAVRLAAANNKMKNGKPFTDREKWDKRQFNALLKEDLSDGTNSDFLKGAFLPLIEESKNTAGEKILSPINHAFNTMQALLEYRASNILDPGLPNHAMPLLERPLVQVLVRWSHLAYLANIDEQTIEKSRLDLLRFALFWMLCVTDSNKASIQAFKLLGDKFIDFPGEKLYQKFVDDNIATRMVSPECVNITPGLMFSIKEETLTGWGTRFEHRNINDVQGGDNNENKHARSLYARWWDKKKILLWLQRELVAQFGGNPMAGRGESTPYDYDHICPSAHWSDLRSCKSLSPFVSSWGHGHVGNSIGNFRVWDSSLNRSDGKASPIDKLGLSDPPKDECLEQLRLSAVVSDHVSDWIKCSGDGDYVENNWNSSRVASFQRAVEKRTFKLYESFYNDLGFSRWSVLE